MIFETLKVRRGRKAAVAVIAPLVEGSRHRLTAIPETAWLDPYMVGFMSMLISLVALKATGGMSSHSVGTVQTEAWSRIVGQTPDLIGEEICLLSAAGDGMFLQGCRNAGKLVDAMEGESGRVFGGGHWPHGSSYHPGMAQPLWSEYFDSHIRLLPEERGSGGLYDSPVG